MSRICIDTSAYSNFRRGEPRVVAHLDRADWVGVPSVVVGELWAGFQLGARTDQNASELDEFLSHAVAETLPADTAVAHIYGEIFADLRRKGRPLPTNDVWIAATAARRCLDPDLRRAFSRNLARGQHHSRCRVRDEVYRERGA